MQSQLLTALSCTDVQRVCRCRFPCTAAYALRVHTRCSQPWRRERRLKHSVAAIGASIDKELSDDLDLLQHQGQEAARESVAVLLQLLRAASLLAALALEMRSLLRHSQLVAAERAAVQQAHAAQEAAAKHAAQHTSRSRGQQPAQQVAEAAAPTPQQHHNTASYALQRGSTWGLLLALLCGALLSWLRRPRDEASQPLSLSEAGSVAALQMSVSQQAAALTDARRQLTKLQLRVRLLSRDLKTTVRQVQQQSQQQAEALTTLAAGAVQQEAQLQDFQALLEAMQVVSSKQFTLLLSALPHISQPPDVKHEQQFQQVKTASRQRQQRQHSQAEQLQQRQQQQSSIAAPAQSANGALEGAETLADAWGSGSGALPPRSAFHESPVPSSSHAA